MSDLVNADIDDKNRKEQQKTLDQAHEQAREKNPAPERNKKIQEFIDSGRSQQYCEVFNKDYGARMGNRAPLYLDLAECVKVFEYKRSYRSSWWLVE